MSEEMQEKEAIKAIKNDLEALVTNCPELEKLESELSKFNLFETLNIYGNEQVHSAFIRWLLDPKEAHGLGDFFLKKFLKKVISENTGNPNLTVSSIDIDVMDMNNCFVRLEEPFTSKRRADISIFDEDNKLYVLIENKIFSGEGIEQTKEYAIEAKRKYPDYKRIFIFLTPSGFEPESEEFLIISYPDIISILKEIITEKKDVIGDGPALLIQQYIRNLEVNILEESEIEELCRKIYQKHKKRLLIKYLRLDQPIDKLMICLVKR
jgi:hypothetical protein